jgi:ABC-type nickel/cobalt efflux system permease component RcnA
MLLSKQRFHGSGSVTHIEERFKKLPHHYYLYGCIEQHENDNKNGEKQRNSTIVALIH